MAQPKDIGTFLFSSHLISGFLCSLMHYDHLAHGTKLEDNLLSSEASRP